MKKNRSAQSAFFNRRALAGLFLCLAGLTLGLLAFGGLAGQSAQAQASGQSEDSDPDLPAFMTGKINKEEYLRSRAEHINKLRGIAPGRPLDPGARGRAIQQMNRQAGISQSSTTTSVAGSTSAPGNVDALSVNSPSINSSTWTSIGPSPLPNGQTFNTNNVAVSGRTVAIAIHPTNSSIAYAGAAQGGVYRTTDGGATWTPLFDNAQTLSIGAIAIAPSQPSTIYVGTGEGNFSGDCFFGVGIYRIDNADSASPTLVGPLNKNSSGTDVLSGWGIDRIVVHPTDPNTIFFGTTSGIGGVAGVPINDTTATSTKPRGLFRSTNAASANPTFQKLTAATDNGGNLSVTDVEFEPGNPNNLLVGIRGTSVAGSGGVYRSTNALVATPTFTRTLAVGSSTVLTRTEIGIAKVGAQVTVFAATTDSSGTLKRSTDGGVTWSAALSGATGFCGGQCDYDMPVAVDPTNANVIYLGGPGDGSPAHIMIKSSNALAGTPTFATVQTGLHADEHAIEIDPSNTNTVWTGNDGGIFKSTNGGTSWTSLNNSGYVATQFQSLALHPIDANFTIGGTQDNGTECQGPCGTFVGNVWNQADYGDGGFSAIDQSAANLTSVNMYHTYYNQTNTLIGYAYVTSTTNAKFTSSPTSDSWSFNGTGGSSTCTSGGGYACTEAVEFYMPMAVGPGTPNPIYTGTDRLHRAATPGASNTTVSQVFATGVPISAIGISRQNDQVRMVGLSNGKVFRTLTAQTTGWPDVTGTIPAGYISRAVIDPTNQNTAFVTLSAYFGTSASHVYKTANLNATTPTWTGVDGGQIPDVPINAFVVDPSNSSYLYAGTDIGVYRSTDAGVTWLPYSNGLPRVAVFDMAIQNPNRILRIATHGRGMWEIFIGATGSMTGTVTDAGNNGPISGATVTTGSNTGTTDANGSYQLLNVPIGTYNVTASAAGYSSSTVSGVIVSDGQSTTQNFALTTAPLTGCLTDTTQADFQAGVGTNVDLTTSPGNITLSASAATLDQSQQSAAGFGFSLSTTSWVGQTFIPAITGRLARLDVHMFNNGGVAGNVTVEVRTISGNLPTNTILATATIPGSTVGTDGNFSVLFSSPASLTSGTVYAFTVRMTSGSGNGVTRSSNNAYANGAAVTSTNSGGSWTAQSTDLVFQTFMSTGFSSSGDLVSETFDSNPVGGGFQRWTTLSWTASTPASTSLKFQAAASNNATGPFSFVGPDGTAGTFFTSTGASLTQFNGNRYLKYRAFLATTNSTATPTVNDVTVCFNNTPKQNQTINFPAIADKTYGDADSDPGATASSGLAVTYNTVGNCSIVSGKVHITSIGSCTVTASQGGSDTYNAASSVGRTFAIGRRNATWTTNSNSKTYGAIDPNPLTTGSGSGFLVSDNVTATYSRAAGETVAGSPYHITATLTPSGVLGNYNVTNDGADFTISKKNATWTTNNNSKTYNSADPNPLTTGSGSGFVPSDSVTASYSRDPGETVTGSPYHITATLSPSGVLDNYNITNNGGNFTVVKAHLTVTADNQSKSYDGSAFVGFTATITGFVNGDTTAVVNGSAGFTGTAVTAVSAGSYIITPTQGTLSAANYDFTPFTNGTLTINKMHLTVTADEKSRTYGAGNPPFTASLTGFVNGETDAGLRSAGKLSGSPSFSGTGPSSTATTAVGDYVITPGLGNLTAANYDFPAISFIDGTLHITKAHLTVTAGNKNKPYDATVYSPFTATITGFVNGQTAAVVSGSADFTGAATTAVNAGTYAITPTAGTLSATNYDFTVFTDGSLTITKATSATTVTANNAIYNGDFHGATATVTGIGGLNESLSASYSGRNATTYGPSSTAPINAGDYTASATFDGDANHDGSNDSKNYTIAKADANIVVTSYTVTYDGNPHTATGSATGVESPTAADLGSLLHLSGTTRTDAGNYTDSWTFDGNANYSPAGGTVDDKINKATAIIVVTPYSVTYNALAHAATGSATGINNESLTGLNVSGTTHTGAGDYPADGWTFTNANYADQAGTVHDQIAKAPSTTTVSVVNTTYDGSPHGGTAGVTGIGGLSQAVTVYYTGRNSTGYSLSATAPTNAGDYTASANYAGDDNHDGSGDARNYSIAKASPVISWSNPAAIVYGTALSGTQLNAVAMIGSLVIPGDYLYDPSAGTVLNAGNGQTLGVTFTPTDTANYNGAVKSVLINVSQKLATVTADNKSKQFSDPLPAFTATIAGLFGTDVLGGSVTLSTTATALSPAGAYSIVAGGSGFNPNYTVSFVNGTLTVTQEDATLTYTGDTLLTAGTSNTTSVLLAAAVQEAQDGYLGNALGGKVVKFSIYKSTNLTLTTPDYTATATISGVNNIATTTIALPDDDYSIKLELVSNLYYTAPVEAAAVTVVAPGDGQASGGGWLTDPNGRRANFAFTVKYVPSGNPKGHSLYIYREQLDLSTYGAPSGLRDYDVIIKSTALSALNLNTTTLPATAAFSGKSLVVATDRLTGVSYTISGGLGLQFEADVTDKGEPGSSDSYALRVWNTSGTYRAVGTYTPSGINTSQVTLGGGNIQVK